MNKRHYEHTLPNIRGSLSNTYETNLFHSLVEQINGGKSRVAELLQKHEIPVPATVPAAGNDEMAAFDMNDFL